MNFTLPIYMISFSPVCVLYFKIDTPQQVVLISIPRIIRTPSIC
nr:MAG TPA: hypothetical protein [Herelleviridae sp.]